MQELDPRLAACLEGADAARERLRALVEGTDDGRFRRRPAEGSWSAAECVAHLTLTTVAYLPLLDDALAAAPPHAPGRAIRRSLVGRFLCWMMEPPSRMRAKTTAPFVPGGDRPKAEVVEEFEASQDALAERIRRSAGLDLGRAIVISPFGPWIRYDALSAFEIVLAHQRRHLRQAERAVGGAQ